MEKKISVNKNDSTFENKTSFWQSLKKGAKSIIMSGLIILGIGNSYQFINGFAQTIGGMVACANEISDTYERVNQETQYLEENTIYVAGTDKSEDHYYFENNNLFDKNGNCIKLDGETRPLFLKKCNVDGQILDNIGLSESLIKTIKLEKVSVDNEFIQYLPEGLEELDLEKCFFITDLSHLHEYCPYITRLNLKSNASLTDYSFIKNIYNLKEINISNSPYITEELLEYLNANNIKTNIAKEDVELSKEIDEEVSEIISPDMNDQDKIKAICLYILEHVKYDGLSGIESNDEPLKSVLEDGKGVCISYAYYTNVLLNKAGIKSFVVVGNGHAWNLIELDDKYYYLDTTNMDGNPIDYEVFKHCDELTFSMFDPESNFFMGMSSSDNPKTIIATTLRKDIRDKNSKKSKTEKMSGKVIHYGKLLGKAYTVVWTKEQIEKLIKKRKKEEKEEEKNE